MTADTTKAAAITIGSIVQLQNNAPDGGYLDTYGWVASKPEFSNVAGSERIFVSTYAKADRGGGTTSWQIVSADGKKDGELLKNGDRIHLRNLYPDAGYLDCCGWIEHLAPFSVYAGKVRSGVFTCGAANRDNGTGIWVVQAATRPQGEPLSAGDRITLRNGYPDTKPATGSVLPETGLLVAYGKVANNPVFADFQDRQLFAFTSTDADTSRDYGSWIITLSVLNSQRDTSRSLFDFFRPELLKGRTHAMESVSAMTTVVLVDAFLAISGIDIENTESGTSTKALLSPEQRETDQRLLTSLLQANRSATAPADGLVTSSPNVIDYDFQVKQIWNLLTLSRILQRFDQDTLQLLMQQLFDASEKDGTLPPLDLMRSCFQHIAADHEIIQQATMQRRWNRKAGERYQSAQALELLVMDKLAMKAIRPFQHLLSGQTEPLAVLTYFSETTAIHQLPYTEQFILIGVSYDRISPSESPTQDETLTGRAFSSFELMAIPHEVGHYLYQHGAVGNQSFLQISTRFADNPYFRWCEELFADVYGCIIAGPLCVFSMQAFLTSGDKSRAWRDDDEHPTPLVRPFILAEILRVLSTIDPKRYTFSIVTDSLDREWTAMLERWGYERVDAGTKRPARIYLQDESSAQLERILNVERVIKTIQPMIEAFARLLLDALPVTTDPAPATADAQPVADIPWIREDSNDSTPYANAMASLTGGKTANEALAFEALLDIKPSVAASDAAAKADTSLSRYLDAWGDKGPHGWGGH